MEKRESKDRAARLLAYTAVAGLGAFGATQTTQAAPILPGPSDYVDIPDITLLEDGGATYLDLDGDSVDDLKLEMLGQSEAWFVRFRAEAINGADEYTNLLKGNANYIRSFNDGDVIGPLNVNCVPGALTLPVAHSNTSNFGDLTSDNYMAIKLSDGDWGWIRMRYFRDGIESGVGYAEVYDYAITPEPGSLGLLAVGAGALAFRRRK